MFASFSFGNTSNFRSEITVKNDKFGWAIWIKNQWESKPVETEISKVGLFKCGDDVEKWTYHILFLEKEDTQWKVKGGYYLLDTLFFRNVSEESFSSPPSFTFPNENFALGNGSGNNTINYSGIWTTASDGGKEIFEDIKFKYKEDSTPWLGRPRESTLDKKLRSLCYKKSGSST